MTDDLHRSLKEKSGRPDDSGGAERNERLLAEALHDAVIKYQYDHIPDRGFTPDPHAVDEIIVTAFKDGLDDPEILPTTALGVKAAIKRGLEAREARITGYRRSMDLYGGDMEDYGINAADPQFGIGAVRKEVFDNPAYRVEFPASERLVRMVAFRITALQELAVTALQRYLEETGNEVKSVSSIIPTADKQAAVIRGMIASKMAADYGEDIDPLYIGEEGLDTLMDIIRQKPPKQVSLATEESPGIDTRAGVAEMIQDFQSQLVLKLSNWEKFQRRHGYTPDSIEYWEHIGKILSGIPIAPLVPEEAIIMDKARVDKAKDMDKPNLWKDGAVISGYTVPNIEMIEKALRLTLMAGNPSDIRLVGILKKAKLAWSEYNAEVLPIRTKEHYQQKIIQLSEQIASLATVDMPLPTEAEELDNLEAARRSLASTIAYRNRVLKQNDRNLQITTLAETVEDGMLTDSAVYLIVLKELVEHRIDNLPQRIEELDMSRGTFEWAGLYGFDYGSDKEKYLTALRIIRDLEDRVTQALDSGVCVTFSEILQISTSEALEFLQRNALSLDALISKKPKVDKSEIRVKQMVESIRKNLQEGQPLDNIQLAWLSSQFHSYEARLKEYYQDLLKYEEYPVLRDKISKAIEGGRKPSEAGISVPEDLHSHAVREIRMALVSAFPAQKIKDIDTKALEEAKKLVERGVASRASGMRFNIPERNNLSQELVDKQRRLALSRDKITHRPQPSPREEFIHSLQDQIDNPLLGLEYAAGLWLGSYLRALETRIASIDALLNRQKELDNMETLDRRIAELNQYKTVVGLRREHDMYTSKIANQLMQEEEAKNKLLEAMQGLDMAIKL